MGGRGSSSRIPGERGKSPKNALLKVTVQSGDEVDLSDFPLSYDKPDPAVSGDIRRAIEAFEGKRSKAKIEFGTVVDKDGKPLGESRGSSGSVRTPTSWMNAGEVFSHNHPRAKAREAGLLGGTFSKADLVGWAKAGVKTFRAAAAEGVYSITKGKGFDTDRAVKYITEVEKRCREKYESAVDALTAKFNTGDISYSEWVGMSNKEFNRYLVEKHNQYRAGRKEYGYDYRLEKR